MRWDQQHVRAPLDLVGQFFIMGDPYRHLTRIPFGGGGQHLFILALAFSQNRDGQSRLLHQFLQRAREDLDALLRGQARHEPRHRPGRARTCGELVESVEPQLLQQVRAAGAFAGQILRPVRLTQMRIGLGIPARVIHSVDNPLQVRAARRDHRVESEPAFGGLDLLRVRWADRGNPIGEDDAALEQVHLAVELQRVRREKPPGQIRQRKIQAPEHSLIGDVVDRQHRLHGELRAARLP